MVSKPVPVVVLAQRVLVELRVQVCSFVACGLCRQLVPSPLQGLLEQVL
jgi:hypothetical protein